MRRREFITLLGGAAAWPLAAGAQQPAGKLPTIGFLGSGSAYGRTPMGRPPLCSVCANSAGSKAGPWRSSTAGQTAASSASLTSPLTSSGSRWLSSLPVRHGSRRHKARDGGHSDRICRTAEDPVGTGLVASLARPGGNITGLSIQQTDLAGKRLEMLARAVFPVFARWRSWPMPGARNAVLEMDEVARSGAPARPRRHPI